MEKLQETLTKQEEPLEVIKRKQQAAWVRCKRPGDQAELLRFARK
jgi:hypothetical protein